ncbi:MAG: bis(5'-nucleosyl)-tetraphosphatase (symmetrical) YqeK [Oscillospiraceae bacterium]|nr:bis(5'-nucleosyl)-tetraphosphatase (symmetrical) YqeK [Oscillospiraceae bacterium]
MYQVKEKIAFLERTLSAKRFRHSCNVARASKLLAQQYGADIQKAYFAGLVHDICKEMPFEKQYEFVIAGDFKPDFAELHSKKLWHGIAGAYFLKTEFHIEDEDILNAVRFHTVGRANMSILEEIIYIADMISEERDYKGVDKMRRLAQKNLHSAMLEALQDTVSSVMKKNGFVPVYTIEAYNFYMHMALEHKEHKEKDSVSNSKKGASNHAQKS